jgi:peroxiredoxin
LAGVEGSPVALADVIARQPSIIIFYRGGWWPYCNKQLGQLQEIETELIEMGFQLIGITTDRPSKIRETLTEHDFTYTVLSDSAMTGAAAFGIAYQISDEIEMKYGEHLAGAAGMDHGILPVPAVFLVGTDGLIYFQYVNPNHRVRLDADVLRSAARAAMAQMTE